MKVSGGRAFTGLSAGGAHTCGLVAGGAAYCWGDNQYGQLGDGTNTSRSIPAAMHEGWNFISLSAGHAHTCGLVAGGAAYCWGDNQYGQLGDGTNTSRSIPAAVHAEWNFISLSAGGLHTCGLTSGGTAYCWGGNRFGELGDGTTGNGGETANRTNPVAVGQGRFSSLMAGYNHTCGLDLRGAASCWGYNGDGRLGDGTGGGDNYLANRSTPAAVIGGLLFTGFLVGGNHTCGVALSGTAYCWGWNNNGQLGDGSQTNRGAPVAVSGGRTFTALVAGWGHTCGLATGGTAYCWGSNANGRLGDGTIGTDRNTPVKVDVSSIPVVTPTSPPSPTPIATISPTASPTASPTPPQAGTTALTRLALGHGHTCGLASGGSAYCWGFNGSGQLGDGTNSDRLTPVAVAGGLAFTSLVAAGQHTCGLVSGGTAYCWGYNQQGQLGDGTSGTDRTTPVAVSGGRSFTALVAGGYHTCGLVSGGTAYCWGNNSYGQLGDGTGGNYSANRTAPVVVGGGRTFMSLVAGGYHTCGLVSGGTAYCWGSNEKGQVGDGTSGSPSQFWSADRTSPVAVTGGRAYTALVAGGTHTCGLATSGTAYCWGYNSNGQLGDGTSGSTSNPSSADRSAPVAVSGGLTYVGLVAGGAHTCGLATGGTAYCWGYNQQGQLGDGTSGTDRTTPVAVSGGRSFTALVAGSGYTCGLVSGGTAYCWGANGGGALGDGTTTQRTVPTAVEVSAIPHTTTALSLRSPIALQSPSPSHAPSAAQTASVTSTPSVIMSLTVSSTASITPHPPAPPRGTVTAQPELLTQILTPPAISSPSVFTQVTPTQEFGLPTR